MLPSGVKSAALHINVSFIAASTFVFFLRLSMCMCKWGGWHSEAFVTAVTGSVTGVLCLSHVSLLLQIKAQSCKKSSVHSVLSSKLAGDVAQLKQKAQVKKNLSGTGSRDKESSPCNSNPKHGHRSQGAGKAESRRESEAQSDTGVYWRSLHLLTLYLYINIITLTLPYSKMICS